MGKSDVNPNRLEELIRGAEPENNSEIVFAICYAGTIIDDGLLEVLKTLLSKVDMDELTTEDWKYLLTGLVMGNTDYRRSIKVKTKGTIH